MKGAQNNKSVYKNKKCAIALWKDWHTSCALLLKSAEAKLCAAGALLLTLRAPLKKIRIRFGLGSLTVVSSLFNLMALLLLQRGVARSSFCCWVEEPARGNLCHTVPTAHTCQIFAHSSKINHSNHVKTWAAWISAARPHIKNHKSKRGSLYWPSFNFITFDLGLKAEIGVPAEAALTCTLLGMAQLVGYVHKHNALWAMEHPSSMHFPESSKAMLAGRKLGGNQKKSARRRYSRNTLSISKFF